MRVRLVIKILRQLDVGLRVTLPEDELRLGGVAPAASRRDRLTTAAMASVAPKRRAPRMSHGRRGSLRSPARMGSLSRGSRHGSGAVRERRPFTPRRDVFLCCWAKVTIASGPRDRAQAWIARHRMPGGASTL